MQGNEEGKGKKTKNSWSLMNHAETILKLSKMYSDMERGQMRSSEETKNSVKSLIKDFCTELIAELD